MALSAISLRTRIKTKVEAKTGRSMPDVALDVWEAVAEAIIDEVKAGQVTVTTTCPAGAGTGTGTVA